MECCRIQDWIVPAYLGLRSGLPGVGYDVVQVEASGILELLQRMARAGVGRYPGTPVRGCNPSHAASAGHIMPKER
jgi:hypothetical protein